MTKGLWYHYPYLTKFAKKMLAYWSRQAWLIYGVWSSSWRAQISSWVVLSIDIAIDRTHWNHLGLLLFTAAGRVKLGYKLLQLQHTHQLHNEIEYLRYSHSDALHGCTELCMSDSLCTELQFDLESLLCKIWSYTWSYNATDNLSWTLVSKHLYIIMLY